MTDTARDGAPTAERCALCDGMGKRHLGPLTDRYFGVPGEFHLQRCDRCGLVWLEGMPDEADVAAYYENYYTHQAPVAATARVARRRDFVSRFWPISSRQRQTRRQLQSFYLPQNGGRLLEVGCGSGKNLAMMRDRGWDVIGQDIDPSSAQTARAVYGVRVEVASLAEVDFAEASFDAIVLNHVLEHLREPTRDLQRCHSLLRPGGKLVIVTPNVGGLGASLLRSRWRGLEPPRHLFLYTVRTLEETLRRSGFESPTVFSAAARTEHIIFDSVMRRLPRRRHPTRLVAAKLLSMSAQVIAEVTRADARGRGDELVAIAMRATVSGADGAQHPASSTSERLDDVGRTKVV